MGALFLTVVNVLFPWFFLLPELRARLGQISNELTLERELKNTAVSNARATYQSNLRLARDLKTAEDKVSTWEKGLVNGYLALASPLMKDAVRLNSGYAYATRS